MPVFIPPYSGDEIKSNAEKKVFEMLQELTMENAYVLHSLGLPKHKSKIYGEVDFVIVCPRGVACLEVKGGRVERRDGLWYFTDRYGVEREKAEGPFEQCKDNMFNLRAEIKSKLAHIKNILFTWGVVFPDIKFNTASEDIPKEVIFDAGTDINEYAARLFDYGSQREQRTIRSLSPDNIKEIVSFLKRDFTFVETLSVRLDYVEKKILRLTENQALILNALEDNDHLLVKGGAGTGKTLLASEYAKKQALGGKRVLYLTYNKNLANNSRKQLEEYADNLTVINIHGLFGNYVSFSMNKMSEFGSEYFSEILPGEFYDFVKKLDREGLEKIQYDVLVMDEAQDILKPNYIECVDYMFVGGFEKGKWAVFYDEKQNIYNPEFDEGLEEISIYNSARFTLSKNCRNTVEIATYNSWVTGTEMPDFMENNNGEEVKVITYRNDAAFAKKAADLIKYLKKEGVAPNEILFLSPKSYEKSILSSTMEGKLTVNPLDDKFKAGKNVPVYATVQGFKGLDAKIVIFIDVDKIYENVFSRLMYTGCSRARSMLYILADEKLAERLICK